MKINDRMLVEITGRQDLRLADFFPERRQAARFNTPIEAAVAPIRNGALERVDLVCVKDISASGISFLYHQPLLVGDAFALRLLGLDGVCSWVHCTVRRREEMAGGLHLLGASFEFFVTAKAAG
jgi:hypothetical protein